MLTPPHERGCANKGRRTVHPPRLPYASVRFAVSYMSSAAIEEEASLRMRSILRSRLSFCG